jgi:dsRNA-specific ribonuclease
MDSPSLPQPITAAEYIEKMLGYRFKDESWLHKTIQQPTADEKNAAKQAGKLEIIGDHALGNLS